MNLREVDIYENVFSWRLKDEELTNCIHAEASFEGNYFVCSLFMACITIVEHET